MQNTNQSLSSSSLEFSLSCVLCAYACLRVCVCVHARARLRLGTPKSSININNASQVARPASKYPFPGLFLSCGREGENMRRQLAYKSCMEKLPVVHREYTYGKEGDQRVHENPLSVRASDHTGKTWLSSDAWAAICCAWVRLCGAAEALASRQRGRARRRPPLVAIVSPIAIVELFNPIALGWNSSVNWDIDRLIVVSSSAGGVGAGKREGKVVFVFIQ